MSRARIVRFGLRYVAGPVVVACIVVFFYRAVRENWASIQAQKLDFEPGSMALAVLCMLVAYLVPTYGWQLTINELAGGNKLTFSQTVATVNSSNLVKYVPGKVLTYALQVYWLANRGFSKSLVVYVNALGLLVSLAVSVIVGFGCLFFAESPIPAEVALGVFVVALVLDLVGFYFHGPLLKLVTRIYGRVFKREVRYVDVPVRLLAELHGLHLIAVVAFGLSSYFAARGIGYELSFAAAPKLMAAILISDTIAFFAVVAPGGLGVREGLMYFVLGGAKGTSLALTLPLAARAVHMFVDLLLGGAAFKLLGNLTKGVVAPPAASGPHLEARPDP